MSRYRNIELSDSVFERDCLRCLTFKSPALGGRGDVTLFIPPGIENQRNVPLILLLHGVYGSHWAWSLKGGAHHTALRLIEERAMRPMIVAMPSDGLWGDGSAYLLHNATDYERWIMDDVVGCVTEVVSCLEPDSPLFIAGLSMGGYGALRLGAKYARRFKAFSGLSSMTQPSQLAYFVEEPLSMYGAALEATDADVLYWMRQNKATLPPFRFDCGMGDDLIEANRELHDSLIGLDIRHEYFEHEGGHTWDYWQTHIADTLLFFERACD